MYPGRDLSRRRTRANGFHQQPQPAVWAGEQSPVKRDKLTFGGLLCCMPADSRPQCLSDLQGAKPENRPVPIYRKIVLCYNNKNA
jgi:hypothetical protein